MRLIDLITHLKDSLDCKDIDYSGLEEFESMILELNLEDCSIPVKKETIDKW